MVVSAPPSARYVTVVRGPWPFRADPDAGAGGAGAGGAEALTRVLPRPPASPPAGRAPIRYDPVPGTPRRHRDVVWGPPRPGAG